MKKEFLKSPSVIAGVLAHAVIFLWLFQLGFTVEERERIVAGLENNSAGSWVKSTLEVAGPIGLLTIYYDSHTDARIYYRYALLALEGNTDYWEEIGGIKIDAERPWPYRDVPVEYQPGALLTFMLPSLLANDFDEYRFWLGTLFGALYVLNLFMGINLFSGGVVSTDQAKRMLWWSVVFLFCFGGIATTRFDHVVVTFILLSALVFRSAANKESKPALVLFAVFGGVAALGVLTKIVPGLVFLAALVILLLRGKGKPKWAGAGAALAGLAGTLIVVNLAFYGIFGKGYLESFTYHMDRGIHLESVYSGALLLAGMAGYPVRLDKSFGAHNIVSPVSETIAGLAPFIFLSLAALIAWRVWKCGPNSDAPQNPRGSLAGELLIVTLAFLLAFILTNKVFSPQYLLWAGPLFASWLGIRRNILKPGYVFLLAAILTQVTFPRLYGYLTDFNPVMVMVLNARNFLMAGIFIWLMIKMPQLLEQNKTGPV